MREIEHRMATMDDCSMLADLNLQFLLEEGQGAWDAVVFDLWDAPCAISAAIVWAPARVTSSGTAATITAVS